MRLCNRLVVLVDKVCFRIFKPRSRFHYRFDGAGIGSSDKDTPHRASINIVNWGGNDKILRAKTWHIGKAAIKSQTSLTEKSLVCKIYPFFLGSQGNQYHSLSIQNHCV